MFKMLLGQGTTAFGAAPIGHPGSGAKPNPYLIEGPAVISFSGGRTSAYMLHQILQAHGGALPDNVHAVFANTGKEREETLRFVYECATRFGVKVHWLERAENGGFIEVGYNSASRSGEPFAALIAKKQYTPNAVTRFCTVELKIKVMRDFARSLGWERWNNIVGLRYDEGHRVLKALERNDAGKERFKAIMPLSTAHVTKRDVMAFWLGDNADPVNLSGPLPQGFDLGLRDYEGNCDLCFLKSRAKLEAIIREKPGAERWWIGQERVGKGRFVTEYSYADLRAYIAQSPTLFDDDEYDAECGLTCAPISEPAQDAGVTDDAQGNLAGEVNQPAIPNPIQFADALPTQPRSADDMSPLSSQEPAPAATMPPGAGAGSPFSSSPEAGGLAALRGPAPDAARGASGAGEICGNVMPERNR